MSEFIKKNIYIIFLFIITLSIGFLTFLTFIDKGYIKLSDGNLQFLLVLNIILLFLLFIFFRPHLICLFKTFLVVFFFLSFSVSQIKKLIFKQDLNAFLILRSFN